MKMLYNAKVEKAICVECKKEYIRSSIRRSGRAINVRPHHSVTCSKECAAKYRRRARPSKRRKKKKNVT